MMSATVQWLPLWVADAGIDGVMVFKGALSHQTKFLECMKCSTRLVVSALAGLGS
jgi:hypothetical protein